MLVGACNDGGVGHSWAGAMQLELSTKAGRWPWHPPTLVQVWSKFVASLHLNVWADCRSEV